MERMTEELLATIEQLKEENKNLKLIQETNEKQIQNDIKERDELREEIKTLKEKVETLELWLDNKEKLNEEYRKLIQKIDQLEEENENLRKDLFHLTNNGKAK
jgi:chromosome segregation ATPase